LGSKANAPQFTYEIDDQALARAEQLDGKLLLVTNVADLTPAARTHPRARQHLLHGADPVPGDADAPAGRSGRAAGLIRLRHARAARA
jgi:hypothetical protein